MVRESMTFSGLLNQSEDTRKEFGSGSPHISTAERKYAHTTLLATSEEDRHEEPSIERGVNDEMRNKAAGGEMMTLPGLNSEFVDHEYITSCPSSFSSTVGVLRKIVAEEERNLAKAPQVAWSEQNSFRIQDAARTGSEEDKGQLRNYDSHRFVYPKIDSKVNIIDNAINKDVNRVSKSNLREARPPRPDEKENNENVVCEDSKGGEKKTTSSIQVSTIPVVGDALNSGDNLHQYKMAVENLTSENSNLRERLAVAEARASHASEVDTLLQESECAVAKLEQEIELMQSTGDAHLSRLQEEAKQWTEKQSEFNNKIQALEKERDSKVREYKESIKQRESTISSLEESLESVERDIVAFQTKSNLELKTAVENAVLKERKKWEKQEKELKDKMKELMESVGDHFESCTKSTLESHKKELKKVQEENLAHLDRIEQQQNHLRNLQMEMSENKVSLETKVKTLEKGMHDVRDALVKSEATVTRLEKEKATSEKEKQMYADELKEMKESRAKMEGELSQHVSYEASSKANIERLEFYLEERDRAIYDLQLRCEQQEEAIDGLRQNVQGYEEAEVSLNKANINLKKELDKSNKLLGETKKTLTQIGNENVHLKEKAKAKEGSLRKELEDAAKIISETESELKRKLDQCQRTIDSLREENVRLEEQVHKTRQNIAEKDQESMSRAKQLTEQSRDLNAVRAELDDAKDLNKHLSSELSRLKAVLSDTEEKAARFDKLKREYTKSETVISELKHEMEQLGEQHKETMRLLKAEFTADASQMQSEYHKERKSVQSLEKKLKESKEVALAQEKELAKQKESMSSYRAEMRRLITSIDSKLRTNRQEKEQLQQTNESLQANMLSTEREVEKIRQELAVRTRRISDQENDLQRLVKDLEKAKASNGALREQVTALRSRLFKSEDMASRAASLQTLVDNLKREKAEMEKANHDAIDDLQRQADQATARKKAMEKELNQNTDLLLKIKNKMSKKPLH